MKTVSSAASFGLPERRKAELSVRSGMDMAGDVAATQSVEIVRMQELLAEPEG